MSTSVVPLTLSYPSPKAKWNIPLSLVRTFMYISLTSSAWYYSYWFTIHLMRPRRASLHIFISRAKHSAKGIINAPLSISTEFKPVKKFFYYV